MCRGIDLHFFQPLKIPTIREKILQSFLFLRTFAKTGSWPYLIIEQEKDIIRLCNLQGNPIQ